VTYATRRPRYFLTWGRLFCISALFATAGCRVDITQRIDVTAKDRETVSYEEEFDREAFQVATQLGGPSAFGADTAMKDGWQVAESRLAGGRYAIIFKRTSSRQDAEAELTRLARDTAAAAPADAFFLGPTAFIGLPITASASSDANVSIPALLRPSETAGKIGRADPAFQLANARVNAAAVNSVVRVFIELRDGTGFHRVQGDFAEGVPLSPASGLTLHVGKPWLVSPIMAFWRSVGPYGVFDYEHYARPLCSDDPKYHQAWLFGAGVYANGARIPPATHGECSNPSRKLACKKPSEVPLVRFS
jgi:hypothetical protein